MKGGSRRLRAPYDLVHEVGDGSTFPRRGFEGEGDPIVVSHGIQRGEKVRKVLLLVRERVLALQPHLQSDASGARDVPGRKVTRLQDGHELCLDGLGDQRFDVLDVHVGSDAIEERLIGVDMRA
jgi:hypothetical protein